MGEPRNEILPVDRTRDEIIDLAQDGLDWATLLTQAAGALRRAIPFVRCCWHPLDPGTVLFTGILCESTGSAIPRARVSGTWIAEHEYLIDYVSQHTSDATVLRATD